MSKTKKWDGDLSEMQRWLLSKMGTKPFKASVWEDGTLMIDLPDDDYEVFALPGEAIEVIRTTPRTALV